MLNRLLLRIDDPSCARSKIADLARRGLAEQVPALAGNARAGRAARYGDVAAQEPGPMPRRCQPHRLDSVRGVAIMPRRDHMQHRGHDPEAIVRRLLQTERKLPSGAREEVLALGADAVPTLLQILDDDESGGWAQIHAVRLLGEMKISAAIGGMLRALAKTDALDVLHDAILVAMPEIGEPVFEPALRAYAETDDLELRGSISSILSRVGVVDDRIFAVLLEMLESGPQHAGDLAHYGDDRALPHLSRAFDAYTLRASDSPFANQDLVELRAAIEDLGGAMTSQQSVKYRKACEPSERWRHQLSAALEPATAVETAPGPRPGRNEPCWCGSTRKYKKCHLDDDQRAARAGAAMRA
jgi:sulfur transfer complex TusBCD TusB component (DsrH family)